MNTATMGLRTRIIAIAAGIALIGAGVSVGVAIGATAAGRTAASGGAIERVNVVRSTEIFNTGSKTFTTIPGATATITVPPGERALLVARFTTQEDCNVADLSPDGKCVARIVANSTEMKPASGGQTIDTVRAGRTTGVRSAAIDRSIGPVGPGTYTIKVQVRVTGNIVILEVTDWHLTVERVHVSG